MKIFNRIFYLVCQLARRINLVLECVGGLDRTVAVFRSCISNIGHKEKKLIEIANDKHPITCVEHCTVFLS